MAHFSFEESVYQFNEDDGAGHTINIEIENSNVAVIENIISIAVTVNTAGSNATQGMYAFDSV